MTEMFTDLLAAQKEMPALQKSAINPHFGNKFIPLDALIPEVLPILNKHNLVLLQQPTTADGKPALRTCLLHASGEVLESTMLLQATKDDPQQQGSAITYARRYSLLAWLGLVADVDDDAESHRSQEQPPRPGDKYLPQKQNGSVPPPTSARHAEPEEKPYCPEHDVVCKLVPAGTSKAGKPYSSFYSCADRSCTAGRNGRGYSISLVDWLDVLSQNAPRAAATVDPDELPFE